LLFKPVSSTIWLGHMAKAECACPLHPYHSSDPLLTILQTHLGPPSACVLHPAHYKKAAAAQTGIPSLPFLRRAPCLFLLLVLPTLVHYDALICYLLLGFACAPSTLAVRHLSSHLSPSHGQRACCPTIQWGLASPTSLLPWPGVHHQSCYTGQHPVAGVAAQAKCDR
jgi:hypothetical protein